MSEIMAMLPKVFGGAGAIGNIFNSIQQAKSASLALDQQKRLNALASNPALLSARIKALQQPLSQGLVSDVTNQVQGELGTRGLSESPAIFGAQLGQSLAPYDQRAQQMAQSALFESLGLPAQASGASPQPVDTSSFWSRFLPSSSTPNYPSSDQAGDVYQPQSTSSSDSFDWSSIVGVPA